MKRTFRRCLRLALALGTIQLLILLGFGLGSRAKPAQLILVLGNTVAPDGTPARRLQARLDRGLALWQQGMAPSLLVSGACGAEGFEEAQVMATYLRTRGVPQMAIFIDNQGWTTRHSADHAQAILTRKDPHPSVIVVSQYYHLLRCALACRQAGISRVEAEAGAYFFAWRDLYAIPREMVGYWVYQWREVFR
jgi:vancomycin permeability regulator SanA